MQPWRNRLFFLAVFLSAFLLFLIQPMLAKFLLPTFGGSASVWAVSLVFYQVALLGGYAYAHAAQRLPKQGQNVLHGLLMLGSLAFLPLAAKTNAFDAHDAANSLLLILTISAGLPYFILASTSPLLQSWAASFLGDNSYRLYAYSNLGSFLGLLAYPLVFEPVFSLRWQSLTWSGLFLLCLALIGYLAYADKNADKKPGHDHGAAPTPASPLRHKLGWLALPFLSTVLLISLNVRLGTDMAPVPLLWVLPLLIYLLTYVIAFEFREWYYRWFFLLLFACSAIFYAFLAADGSAVPFSIELITPLLVLFSACMVLHGELFSLRPAPQYLTGYYLFLSAGGAAGGLFAGLAAPKLFPNTYELWGALFLTACFGVALFLTDTTSRLSWGQKKIRDLILVLTTLSVISALVMTTAKNFQNNRLQIRNFYGMATVRDRSTPDEQAYRSLRNGSTLHGIQYQDEALRCRPTSYYDYASGVGRAWQSLRQDQPIKVGVVGLGAGTLQAYAQDGDQIRYYEIDPKIIPIAKQEFSFLHCGGSYEIALGDARQTLEREQPQGYDLLVLDAFSSDAIPVHLLTREAFAVYAAHIKQAGILAVHISNRYLDLLPVVVAGAQSQGLSWLAVENRDVSDPLGSSSDWVLLSKNPAILENELFNRERQNQPSPEPLAWTDQYSNLLNIIVW